MNSTDFNALFVTAFLMQKLSFLYILIELFVTVFLMQ